MTAGEFRELALAQKEAAEGSHMGHPDFRVRNKIFATLTAEEDRGVVKLTPEQQATFVSAEPEVFSPCAGAWGLRGYTFVELRRAKKYPVKRAIEMAWRNTAPKSLTGV